MPTAFITVWDSYTNSVQQLYLPVDFKQWEAPSGKPVILHAYTAGVVHEVVCRALKGGVPPFVGPCDPADWEQVNLCKPDDEHLVITVRDKADPARIRVYALRWHY